MLKCDNAKAFLFIKYMLPNALVAMTDLFAKSTKIHLNLHIISCIDLSGVKQKVQAYYINILYFSVFNAILYAWGLIFNS